ncbi:MAG: DNA mismatch repair endonuclease MutL [Bacteroidales bacterium]|nr:DNA mismatch repair endonuclease MutL [Bacteroidales bacterium]
MDSVINLLPEFIANQIAAGEVVNRPASAVKELLENAVDAGASEIELHIQDGGRTLIQVVDNGCGMSGKDAERCFLPHATSKLHTADDLQHIRTMGFRGEALSSIAAVAQVELHTRLHDSETGTRVCIEGNQIKTVESCVCPPGTVFSVRNLYFNTPARREFLKSDEVEYRYIEEEFSRIALAQPGICFQLYRNGQKIYHLEAANLNRRIIQLMGKAYENRLVKTAETVSGLKLMGYICSPAYSIKGRNKQFIFVNRRYIRHGGLSNAIEKAYQGLLPEGKSPVFFLHLEVEPENIDVNIHPTKTEIRFRNQDVISGVLQSAVKHALGLNQMRNVIDFESSQALPYEHKPQGYVPPAPSLHLNPDYNPFTNPRPGSLTKGGGPKGFPDARHFPDKNYSEAYAENFALMQASMQIQDSPVQLLLDCCQEVESDTRLDEPPLSSPTEKPADKTVNIFQLFNTYIVTPLKSGLALIDQEAASERIIYNDYTVLKEGNLPSQSTLFPQTVELSTANAELLQDIRNELNTLGWSIEWVGGTSFLVSALPVGIQESRVQDILEGIIESYNARLPHIKGNNPEDIALAVAKELSIKTGEPLSHEEILYLTNRLFSGPAPDVSPSGKPIVRILNRQEIEGLLTQSRQQKHD